VPLIANLARDERRLKNAIIASALPTRVDLGVGAEFVAKLFFAVPRRILGAWPPSWRRVSGNV
jgi:hypothetical protein